MGSSFATIGVVRLATKIVAGQGFSDDSLDNSMSVGNPLIDSEHKRLIDILDRLHTAIEGGYADDLIGVILCDLSEYCCYHFNHEELEMMQLRFPDFAAHKQLHDDFISKLDVFVFRHESRHEQITLDVVKFLNDWLREHILVEDRKLLEVYTGHSHLETAAFQQP